MTHVCSAADLTLLVPLVPLARACGPWIRAARVRVPAMASAIAAGDVARSSFKLKIESDVPRSLLSTEALHVPLVLPWLAVGRRKPGAGVWRRLARLRVSMSGNKSAPVGKAATRDHVGAR